MALCRAFFGSNFREAKFCIEDLMQDWLAVSNKVNKNTEAHMVRQCFTPLLLLLVGRRLGVKFAKTYDESVLWMESLGKSALALAGRAGA